MKNIEKFSANTKTWLEHVPTAEQEVLTHACEIAYALAEESFIERGLAIATELQALKPDPQTLATAIIYPAYRQSQLSPENLEKLIDPALLKLLIGTRRMEVIDSMSKKEKAFNEQRNLIDNLRKMLLAMVDDIRVVIIKLAERLVALKSLRKQSADEQKLLGQQVMDIYAPLANRLGIGQFKWQMEDWAFRYLDPENYHSISKSLKMRRTDREEYIHRLIEQIKNLFANTKMENIHIAGRPKHIFSIYRKLQRKHIDINQIYDTSAVRILVPSIEDCYSALGIIHTEWQPIAAEFDDYIAKPKTNGYRSIHTAVIGPDNHPVEIQIRTSDMHKESELGVAAHWKYKEGKKIAASYEEKILWLRDVMGWQKELTQETKSSANLYQKIFEDRVYVFTPKGDVLDLRAGATSLDMAYLIHTEIGHRCRGAKVNGVMVTLTYALKTGDRVEILTTKSGHPSRDWMNPHLGYLKTEHALAKVRHWFHQQNSHENIPTPEEKVTPKSVPTKFELPKSTHATRHNAGAYIGIEGIGNLLTQLARCCRPIPGDPIIGYITQGRGISIHHQNCFNIKQALKSRSHRIIAVNWGKALPKKYPVDLVIETDDRPALLRDISNIIADEQIPILALNCHVDKLHNRAFINLTIEISGLDSLNKITRRLKQLPEISVIKRRR